MPQKPQKQARWSKLETIRRDSVVVAISGAFQGKSGKVLSVDRDKGTALVEGLNRRKRATRRSQANPQGGIVEKECPIPLSKLMLQTVHDARQARRHAVAGKQKG